MLVFFYTVFFAFLTLVQKTIYDCEPNLQEYQGNNLNNHRLRENLKHLSLNMAASEKAEALSLPWIKTLPADVQEAAESISSYLPNLFPKEVKKSTTKSKRPPSSTELQADDHSVYIPPPLLEFAELLSTPPAKEVEADWSVVCGTFTHYDNKNWKNFLRQSGAPYLYRMLAANTYETATISRIFKVKEETDVTDSENQKESQDSSKDFEVLIHAVTWFLEFDTKFRLGETFNETDPDKTESKTTFFFVTPYHLVQSKIKAKYRLLNIWHFWENGFNMTILDKDRMSTAQKFFKRIK